jgi:hypothetical protein
MKRIFAAALLAGLFWAANANAATVTGVYYGELTTSSDPAFPYLSVGETYRIAFSYDTSVADVDPDPGSGQYPGAVSGNVAFSNGFNLSFAGGIVYVGDNVEPGDSDYLNFGYQAAVTSNFPTGLYASNGITWTLVDLTRSALSSDQLPTSYLSAALFAGEGRFDIGFAGIGRPGVGLTGTLTSAPNPAALPLFASALAGLGFAGWRRRKSGKGAA